MTTPICQNITMPDTQQVSQDNKSSNIKTTKQIQQSDTYEQSTKPQEKQSVFSSIGNFFGSLAINSVAGIGGGVLGGIVGTMLLPPPFGTIIGTAIGGGLGSGAGDLTSQLCINKSEWKDLSISSLVASTLIGSITGGANGLINAGKELVKLGAKEAGEKLLTGTAGKISQVIAPQTQAGEALFTGLKKRAVSNAGMGAITGVTSYTLDENATSSDILEHIVTNMIFGEALHLGAKGLSIKSFAEKADINDFELNSKINKLTPGEEVSIHINDRGILSVQAIGNSDNAIATIKREADNSFIVENLGNPATKTAPDSYDFSRKSNLYRMFFSSSTESDVIGPSEVSMFAINDYPIVNLQKLSTYKNLDSAERKALDLLDGPDNIFVGKSGYFIPDYKDHPKMMANNIIADPYGPLSSTKRRKVGSDPSMNSMFINRFGLPLNIKEETLEDIHKVFYLIHEYGHSQDPNNGNTKGIKKDIFDRRLHRLKSLMNSPEQAHITYRKIPSEQFADNYAIDFLKQNGHEIFSDNPELVQYFPKPD